MEIIHDKGRLYYSIMIFGAVCTVIMSAYYQMNLACKNMVVSEIILTTVLCLLAMWARHEYKAGTRPLAHWAMLAGLLLWIAILPVKILAGMGVDSFLHTRLLAYGTMAVTAMAQVIAVAIMLQRLAIRQTA